MIIDNLNNIKINIIDNLNKIKDSLNHNIINNPMITKLKKI